MWEWFEQLVWRPCTALAFSLEIATREITPRLIVDTMLSRAVHALSRQGSLQDTKNQIERELAASPPQAARRRDLPRTAR